MSQRLKKDKQTLIDTISTFKLISNDKDKGTSIMRTLDIL